MSDARHHRRGYARALKFSRVSFSRAAYMLKRGK